MTVGDVGDLIVGKNAVYYDNSGLEWDAVITKIIDNPISVAQSFWSPYRRMAKTVENLINKSAADKDAKMMADATAKINAAPAALPADGAKPAAAPPFDIAKFAGIFAAIGMAVGMIGSALVSIFEGLNALPWWKLILVFVAIMLVISGPAMVLAWLKLRRRNIAPLLNANGIQIPQTDPGMLSGIWTVFALAPAIGRFMKGVTLLFFNVHGKTRDTMMFELAKIRAAKILDSEPSEQ